MYSSPYCHCCPHISSCFQTAASLLPRKMSGSPPLSSALRKGRRLPVSVSSYTSPPSSRLITSILPPAAHSHTSRRVETASDAYNALFCSRYVQSIIYLIYILTGDVGIFKEIYLSIYLLFLAGSRSKGLTRQSMTDIIRYAFQLNRFSGQTDCVLVRNGLWITPIIKAADTLFRGLRLIFLKG